MYLLFYPCGGQGACGIKLSPRVLPISTAPRAINHVLGKTIPSQHEGNWNQGNGWVATLVGGARTEYPFTSRTMNYCGLEHPARLWYDEGNAEKDEMAGLPSPSQAIPAG